MFINECFAGLLELNTSESRLRRKKYHTYSDHAFIISKATTVFTTLKHSDMLYTLFLANISTVAHLCWESVPFLSLRY